MIKHIFNNSDLNNELGNVRIIELKDATHFKKRKPLKAETIDQQFRRLINECKENFTAEFEYKIGRKIYTDEFEFNIVGVPDIDSDVFYQLNIPYYNSFCVDKVTKTRLYFFTSVAGVKLSGCLLLSNIRSIGFINGLK